MKNRRISIIIPSYKAENFICRTVDSCLNQNDVEVEVIIIEDGIFDDTQQVLRKYESIDNVTLFTLEKNMGACYARNYGLKKSSFDYVVFLDADDFFEGDILKGMYDSLVLDRASVTFSTVQRKSDTTKGKKFIPPAYENNIDIICRMISGYAGPPPCGIMWKKSEIIRIGGWNEEYSKNQDGELIIRAMFKDCKPTVNHIGQAIYWQHDGERISARANPIAFYDQEKLEIYIQNNINKDKKYNEIEFYLNAYRFGIMLRAYYKNMPEIYKIWKEKVNQPFYKYKFRSKKKLIGFLIYKLFGIKFLVYLLKKIKLNII